jgi:hypothetical protein
VPTAPRAIAADTPTAAPVAANPNAPITPAFTPRAGATTSSPRPGAAPTRAVILLDPTGTNASNLGASV